MLGIHSVVAPHVVEETHEAASFPKCASKAVKREQGTLMPSQLLQRKLVATMHWTDPLRISAQA